MTNDDTPHSPPQPVNDAADHRDAPVARYIVGLGASAGGLEALAAFFSAMPADSGLGFVVVQHLSPDYKSLMVELLSKHTAMPVSRVTQGMPVRPNAVHLIPPKMNMTIFNGRLQLKEKDTTMPVNLPIDIFFRSLAEDMGERAIGIILSGTGSDGTRGVRAIKESGGTVMVQKAHSAKFDGMPRSAISTGVADYILPPEAMPSELISYLDHHSTHAVAASPAAASPQESSQERIIQLLRNQTGVDFGDYKPSTVIRRISRRMHVNKLDTLSDYAACLLESPREVTLLYKEILIGVTSFFRDTEAFSLLKEKVLPALVEGSSVAEPVRLWCAGCSTGEEAYSLAMLLSEAFETSGKPANFKIFATDIDRDAIDVASSGVYPESIAADVSPERLKRFFTHADGNYTIRRPLREQVVFAHHNLSKDPPFTRMDFISCRNLLIYLQPVLQQKVMAFFSFALNDGGILFLGSSESLGEMSRDFTAIDGKWKIFALSGRHRPVLSHTLAMPALTGRHRPPQTVERLRSRMPSDSRLTEQICRAIIDAQALCCLVIDDSFQLLYVFGNAQSYLSFPSGEISFDVLNLMPRELSLVLSTALHRVRKEKKEIIFKEVAHRCDGRNGKVDLRVVPYIEKKNADTYYLVFIEAVSGDRPAAASGEVLSFHEHTEQRITDLEQDLQYTRENLQATIEELETANEELQATNEELLSSNEELQSTNEELQSVNEELYTVNTEYQNKIEELTDLNNDMNNLMRCTDIGTVFVDSDSRIRRFTPAAARYINLMGQDLGRALSDISTNLRYDSLADDVRFSLDTGNTVEKEALTASGQPLLVKVFPYLDGEDSIDGSVITFVDVTAIKKAERDLHKMTREKDIILETVSDVILYFNAAEDLVWANNAAFEIFGADERKLIGTAWRDLWGENGNGRGDDLSTVIDTGKPRIYQHRDHTDRCWDIKDVPIIGDGGRVRAVVEIARIAETATGGGHD